MPARVAGTRMSACPDAQRSCTSSSPAVASPRSRRWSRCGSWPASSSRSSWCPRTRTSSTGRCRWPSPSGCGTVLRFDLASLAHGCGARLSPGTLVGGRRGRATGPDEPQRLARLRRAPDRRRRASARGASRRPDLSRRGRRQALRGPPQRPRARRSSGSVVFAVPGGVTWPLPLYELALLTAEHLADRGPDGRAHDRDAGGRAARPFSAARRARRWRRASSERGIRLLTGTYPEAVGEGELRVVPGPPLPADVVVALPRLRGVPLAGVPQDEDFFVPRRRACRVTGLEGVYAAGDITTFPVKQGGLAAQQADARPRRSPPSAGADVTPRAVRPGACAGSCSGARRSSCARARRRPRRRLQRGNGGALVAGREDRRPLPQPVPRRARGPRLRAAGGRSSIV